MRNISQTIFNIDKMEKIIKTLPELKSIIDANKYHTFDYTEGLSISDGIDKITTNGGNEVYLILNTDDLILNAYPKEETDEEPFISFTLENIKYNLFID